MPTIAQIQRAVCEHYGLAMGDLLGPSHRQAFARPRRVGYWLAREYTSCSWGQISSAFGGRDHTTVLYGWRKVQDAGPSEDILNLHWALGCPVRVERPLVVIPPVNGHCACGKALSLRNETGSCRSCNLRANATDPVLIERRRIARRRAFAEDPSACERLRAHQLAWCPPELQGQYKALRRRLKSQGYSAAAVRKLVEEDIPGTAAHARRAIANLEDARRIRVERERQQAY